MLPFLLGNLTMISLEELEALEKSQDWESASWYLINKPREYILRKVSSLCKLAEARAKKLGLEYSDSIRPIIKEQLFRGHCTVTGIRLAVVGYIEMCSPTIDRIDPDIGYIESNVRVVCFAYNCFKGRGTDAECVLLASLFLGMRGYLCLSPECLKRISIIEK